jgi:hypothetical protein
LPQTPRLKSPKQALAKKHPYAATRTRRKPCLLIIECNSPKLQSQGLSYADELGVTAHIWADSVVVKGGTQSELCRDLGLLGSRKFEYILVIGHSNLKGIFLTSDRPPVRWTEFPPWITVFKPTKVFLIGCEAGRYLPAAPLFEKIRTLREVYGSPIRAGKDLAKAMHILLPILCNSTAEDLPSVIITQLSTWLITNQVLFRYTRQGINKIVNDPATSHLNGMVESLYPDLFAAVREWLTTR